MPVFAERLQGEEITDERICEYLYTTCTRHPTSEDYPEPANKSLDLVNALVSDFQECKAQFEGDNSECDYDWWRLQCVSLESRLRGIMATTFRMRGLHVVARIVDEDKINDDSGEHPWQLCFTCSCTRWIANGYCVCVQMVGHWYDWGWPGADVEDVHELLPANKKKGRPRKAAQALHRQPADHDAPPGGSNLNSSNLRARWRDSRYIHYDLGDVPNADRCDGYQKAFGPQGFLHDKVSFRKSLQTGKRIPKDDLKQFLGFVAGRVGGANAILSERLADGVDMDSFFSTSIDGPCAGPWVPNKGTKVSKEKCHVSAIVAAWSDARLFDEFLSWGYDLPLFAWSLANLPVDLASESTVGMVAAHNYDLDGDDWPRMLVRNWDDTKDTAWQQAVDNVMAEVRQFAVARICDWLGSGDWGGWGACQPPGVHCVKGLLCICGGTMIMEPGPAEGLCDLCEGALQANDAGQDGVRFCGRRRKQWGKSGPWGNSGARMVRCNVHICKVCADSCDDGDVVGVRDNGPGEWRNDEVGSAVEVDSPSQEEGEEPKKKASSKLAAKKKKESSGDGDSSPEEEQKPKEKASRKASPKAAKKKKESSSDDDSSSEEEQKPKKKASRKASPKAAPQKEESSSDGDWCEGLVEVAGDDESPSEEEPDNGGAEEVPAHNNPPLYPQRSTMLNASVQVEEILDHRRSKEDGGKFEFKIRWKGYGPKEDTWEIEDNVHCDDLLKAFWGNRRVALDGTLASNSDDDEPDDEPEVVGHSAGCVAG